MADQTYWKRALERSEHALKQKALVPLSTSRVELQGPNADQFELRGLNDRLPKHHRSEGPKINPFRPWDPELAIDKVGHDHVLILNKYPVQTGHMLLITREWASQVDWLTLKDWRALVSVDHDSTGLWFLNSGPLAGAVNRIGTFNCCPGNPINAVAHAWIGSNVFFRTGHPEENG